MDKQVLCHHEVVAETRINARHLSSSLWRIIIRINLPIINLLFELIENFYHLSRSQDYFIDN